MTPSNFKQANRMFTAPEGMDETQVASIPACALVMNGGPLDGSAMVVVAWKPSEEELKELNNGGLVYLSVLGGLPPHTVGTSFPFVIGE